MEDSLLLHVCVLPNEMTDCSRLLSKNGADISFLKSVCTLKTAKIPLIHLSKCIFVNLEDTVRAIGNYGVGILPSRSVFFSCKEIKYERLRDKIINSQVVS